MNEIRYLLFPIELLQESEIKKVCDKALDYGIYRKALDFIVEGEIKVMPHHIEQSLKYFGLSGGNLPNMAKNGKVLFDTFNHNNPMVSISKDILMQYYKEDKTDFEVLTFRAYCAIRSILITKPYAKATNEYLIARMYGFRNVADSKQSDNQVLPRYQLDKIKLELQKDWYLIYYSRQTRGFYLSFSISLEKLIYHAELNRESYKAKTLKKVKDEAYQKVMLMMKKPP
jgi:hypothetical protein